VIYGDVVFDKMLGGTILSTEDLFAHLAGFISPTRFLLAGSQPGVWADFPDNTHLLTEITPITYPQNEVGLRGSAATDVTGGMAEKVRLVVSLVKACPGLKALIFSGETPGNVHQALVGETLGTQIHG
jgi:isopentenyl phosphate kinase